MVVVMKSLACQISPLFGCMLPSHGFHVAVADKHCVSQILHPPRS
jgi:hypothetical protein